MVDHSAEAARDLSYLSAGSSYLEEIYDTYLTDPNAVEAHWCDYFEKLAPANGTQEVNHSQIREYFLNLARSNASSPIQGSGSASGLKERKQAHVSQLINAYRTHGHHNANLDPLGLLKKADISDLTLAHHGLSDADFDMVFHSPACLGLGDAPLSDIVTALKETYCKHIGVEYMHLSSAEEVYWLQQRLESVRSTPNYSDAEKIRTLKYLTMSEGLEKYLGRRYVGQKRFSLEGGESTISALDKLISDAQVHGVKEVVIGMAHRGRLNVLVNLLGKTPEDLFEEFEGKKTNNGAYSGDVKYHQGFSSDIKTETGEIHLALAFNPSHLEIIGPVVEGSVHARQCRRDDMVERKQVVPVLIHGDAAFSGQGVVMETFSMSQTRGFTTGGTVHFVINNQIGFTISNPLDSRSTFYCTDVAKMIEAPIFHVNGDDPEAVSFVTGLALDYRMKFKKDVVIDIFCYRRHGHNEADEPAATQPLMYRVIRQHRSTRELYAQKLVETSVMSQQEADNQMKEYRDNLDAGRKVAATIIGSVTNSSAIDWQPFVEQGWRSPCATAVDEKTLMQLAASLATIPEGMQLQMQVERLLKERAKMTNKEISMDWGYAEALAYGCLLLDGYPVRLCGQDSRRNTFSYRHAELHDFNTGETYMPLANIKEGQSTINIIDSLLSEEAVLGFEYGFSTTEPNTLVIWEAQFGDFANGAQVIIDQFISSGHQKWGRLSGLVMFLPHGYEGQGPEHSSARLERYLQLCAQHNMQVCVPSTPAQNFHMLRRQMLRPFRAPLIVMTPKSLLRNPLATSDFSDLTDGKFHLLIPEVDDLKAEKVKRVVLCSGKVYYDLLQKRRKDKREDVAILRVEQLYPFPEEELVADLSRYKNSTDLVWCQEEPKNQGAWYATRHYLEKCLPEGQTLHFAGRAQSASPATGSMGLHNKQQASLVEEALGK